MKCALIFLCLASCCVVKALPRPQEDDESPPPPPEGSKPPPFLETVNADAAKPVDKEPVESSLENGSPALTPAPPAPAPPPATTAQPQNIAGDAGLAATSGTSRVIPTQTEDDDALTPIIFLVLILVLIILLLIILFGCYFMKKLHGKAIFTTGGPRYRNPPVQAKAAPTQTLLATPPGDVVHHESKTFETLIPGGKETTHVTTTKTTKTITSASNVA